MKPVMTFMGSLLLAGNLLLAVPVRQNTVLLRNAEQSETEVRKAIAEQLENRGLERESANHLVTESFARSGALLSPAVSHLRMLFPELTYDQLIEELSARVLRRETPAFDDYDYLAGMLHRMIGFDLSASQYDRLRHCVLLNRSLFKA